ncbi:unnamed protein product, partial [Symbiodinium natans]
MRAAHTAVWIWDPVDASAVFHHPQEIPEGNEELSKERFMDRMVGARLNKLSKATLLDQKGPIAMVSREDGSSHEVPTGRMLPYYEGLLVLQELEAKDDPKVTWFNDRYRNTLNQERKKHKKLHGTLYVEKKLMSTCVTGKGFLDADDKSHDYRRTNVKETDNVSDGEEVAPPNGFWQISDITGYMPPWEAFCHERGGFYQDFYQVQWKKPLNKADHAKVENRGDEPGSTWEPDDCIPPCLDGLRLREKGKWLKRKREQEQKESNGDSQGAAAAKSKRPRNEGSPKLLDGGSPPEVEKPPPPPPKMGRYRRNGTPLIQDMFRLKRGHDFDPPKINNPDVRTGWPKKAEDYPPGYGCADPPGLCSANCDCMDDQRAQKSWETSKNWLEDGKRHTDATMALDMLSAQSRFVRRRGQVTKCCYFETNQTSFGDQTHTKAALTLAKEFEDSVKAVLKEIPISVLEENGDSVRIPCSALLKPSEDYAPVQFQLSQTSTARQWLSLGEEDGRLSLIGQGPPSRPAPFRVEFVHPEGMTAVVDCMVTDTAQRPWLESSAAIAQRFLDVTHCPLSRNARIVLQEHLGKIYNFEAKRAKEISLGRWLNFADLIIRMLRTTAMAHVVKSE